MTTVAKRKPAVETPQMVSFGEQNFTILYGDGKRRSRAGDRKEIPTM